MRHALAPPNAAAVPPGSATRRWPLRAHAAMCTRVAARVLRLTRLPVPWLALGLLLALLGPITPPARAAEPTPIAAPAAAADSAPRPPDWTATQTWPTLAPAATLEITQALFTPGGSDRDEAVALPHTWNQRERPGRGSGTYRLAFVLPAEAVHTLGLRIDRLADQHEVVLNGARLSGHIDRQALHQPLSRAGPAWLALPSAMLRPGLNRLEIHVAYSTRAGLSPVWVGEPEPLRLAHEREEHLDLLLPVMLNCAGSAMGLFMTLLWLRRRQEVLLGAFGLLWLLISVRSTVYSLGYPNQQGLWFDGFMYISQILSAMLLGLLALALADRSHHRWRWAVIGVTLPLMLAGVPGALFGALDTLRTWGYPLVLGAVIPALAMLGVRARRLHTADRLPMLAALALLVVAAGHDYLAWRGELSVMARYWMPLLLPVVFSVFAWTLVQHMVNALEQVERLNAELEQRVAERTRALEHANQTKTRFLAAASHDLRQPVVTIGLMIDLLREHIVAPAQRQMIDRVNAAVAAMEVLLKGLLDLSRLEAGTVQPRHQPLALQCLFDAVASHSIEAAHAKGLQLRLRPTALAVHSDAVLLEQILRNLVDNAVRYTEHGGVLVCARRRGEQVLLQVWDTGSGIPADQQERVFEEFVQAHSTPSAQPAMARRAGAAPGRRHDGNVGLGLGLAIVRRAVRLLGHHLMLRSEPGHGSCFSLTLPAATTPPRSATPGPRHSLPLRGWRIGLVDDDDAVRAALTARLHAWGATVDSHASLLGLRQRLALEPPGRCPFDILLTDHRLGSASGLDVIDALHTHAGRQPALVVTGDTAPAELARLAASGVPVLNKPFRAEVLLAALVDARAAFDGAGSAPDGQ